MDLRRRRQKNLLISHILCHTTHHTTFIPHKLSHHTTHFTLISHHSSLDDGWRESREVILKDKKFQNCTETDTEREKKMMMMNMMKMMKMKMVKMMKMMKMKCKTTTCKRFFEKNPSQALSGTTVPNPSLVTKTTVPNPSLATNTTIPNLSPVTKTKLPNPLLVTRQKQQYRIPP